MTITLKELTQKYGVDERKARRALRNQGIKKVKYHWQWKQGTKRLEQVEDILKGLGGGE